MNKNVAGNTILEELCNTSPNRTFNQVESIQTQKFISAAALPPTRADTPRSGGSKLGIHVIRISPEGMDFIRNTHPVIVRPTEGFCRRIKYWFGAALCV